MAHSSSKNHPRKRDLLREKNKSWELPQTFLIEFEGAILNSIQIHQRIYNQLLENAHVASSKNEFQMLFGLSVSEFLKELSQNHDLRKKLPELIVQYQHSFASLTSASPPPLFTNAKSFLEHSFHLGLSLGLVGIQNQTITKTLLKEYDLNPLIEEIFLPDDDQISNLYQALMNFFGSKPEDTVCVVYSQQALQQAHECGCHVWQFKPHSDEKGQISFDKEFLKFSSWENVCHMLQQRYHK